MGIFIWGILGFFLYKAMTAQSTSEVANDDTLTNPLTNADLQTQPSQKFPLEIVKTDRVDQGADQPWYVDSRAFMGKPGITFFDSPEARDANIMSYNTNEFWDDLNQRYMQ